MVPKNQIIQPGLKAFMPGRVQGEGQRLHLVHFQPGKISLHRMGGLGIKADVTDQIYPGDNTTELIPPKG